MDNQLTSAGLAIGGLTGRLYYAKGELDRSSTAVITYSNGEVCLMFGPMNIILSPCAAAELGKHITQAVESIGGGK